MIALSCRQCSFYAHLPVGVAALSHPGLAGTLYDQGVDVRERRLWELDFVVDPDRIEVVSADPPAVAITIDAGHDPLRVVVDDAFSIRRIERRLDERAL